MDAVKWEFDDADAAAVRAGDPDALARVWRATARPLVAYLRSQGLSDGDAEDLAQESYLELVRSCRSITGNAAAVRSWLFRAAYHNVLDWRRASGRRPLVLVPDRELDRADAAADVEVQVEMALEAAGVREAMRELTPEQQQVVALRFLAGLSTAEVAQIVGRREGAVRALQHRAVATLARRMAVTDQPVQAPR